MKRALIVSILMIILMSSQSYAYFFNYPRDGSFKQQSIDGDVWFYKGDPDWTIKAPDKWQHMMGSYASAEFLSLIVDDKLAGGLVFTLGILKEVEDGYREGWSIRDIFMDAAGVGASLFNNDRYKVWCDWKDDNVQLKLSISLK